MESELKTAVVRKSLEGGAVFRKDVRFAGWAPRFHPVVEGMAPEAGVPGAVDFFYGTRIFPSSHTRKAFLTGFRSSILRRIRWRCAEATILSYFPYLSSQLFGQRPGIFLIDGAVGAGIVAALPEDCVSCR